VLPSLLSFVGNATFYWMLAAGHIAWRWVFWFVKFKSASSGNVWCV